MISLIRILRRYIYFSRKREMSPCDLCLYFHSFVVGTLWLSWWLHTCHVHVRSTFSIPCLKVFHKQAVHGSGPHRCEHNHVSLMSEEICWTHTKTQRKFVKKFRPANSSMRWTDCSWGSVLSQQTAATNSSDFPTKGCIWWYYRPTADWSHEFQVQTGMTRKPHWLLTANQLCFYSFQSVLRSTITRMTENLHKLIDLNFGTDTPQMGQECERISRKFAHYRNKVQFKIKTTLFFASCLHLHFPLLIPVLDLITATESAVRNNNLTVAEA